MSKSKVSKLPKISIVIPSLNKANFIKETLESIVNQDYPNLEVIIQDGGSIDRTVQIIKKYADKYPEIVNWESSKDKGQVNAIKKGLKKAKGQILTYINADDLYEKEALKKVGEYFVNNPKTLWLAGKGRVINSEGKVIAERVTTYKNFLLNLNSYILLLIVNYLVQPSVFISRSAYEKYGPFTGSKSGVMEYDLWLKLGKIQMPKVLKETFASFRLTKGSLSTVNFENILSEDYKIANKYTKDPIILFFHWLHNLGRVITLYTSRL